MELVFDELKTHMRGPGTILRSRKPELVEQEIWGLLLTHYGIRHLMREAAEQAELGPDRISQRLTKAAREAIEETIEKPNPVRRERSCPRAVKRPQHTVFLMKRRDQKNIEHGSPPTIRMFHPAA